MPLGQRISGRDVEVRLPSGILTHFDSVNLNLASGTKAVNSAGYPAGWVYGEVTGDGDLQVDPDELVKLLEEAESAGSWEEMDALDLVLYANTGELELKIEAFGAKLDFPDVKVDAKGGDKLTHGIKFQITGTDYVHINGVPLARAR